MSNNKSGKGDGDGVPAELLAQIQAMQAQLAQLVEKATETKVAAEAPVAESRSARGSRDVTEQPHTLEVRAEQLLRGRLWKPQELAIELGVTPQRLQKIVKTFGSRLHNTGSEDFPKWTLPIGDDAPVEEIVEAVGNLLRDRPFERPELLAATRVRDNRIGGALRRLQREGAVVENWGSDRQARWVIVPVVDDDTEDR